MWTKSGNMNIIQVEYEHNLEINMDINMEKYGKYVIQA